MRSQAEDGTPLAEYGTDVIEYALRTDGRVFKHGRKAKRCDGSGEWPEGGQPRKDATT